MNNKKLYTIIFLCIFGLVAFGFVWSYIVTFDIRHNTESALKQEQKVEVSNLILTETKSSIKYWELYAKKGFYEGGENTVLLKDILGNFYDDEENVILSFKADSGIFLDEKKEIVLEGDILAVAKDGSSIMAEKVVWKGKDEDITASGNVRINRNNELITKSERAVFNAELTYFRIEGKSESKIFDNRSVK